MEKQCNYCLQFKDVSNFKKHSETRDGLSNFCKECTNEKQRIYRQNNKNSCTHKYEKTEHGFLMRLYRNMKSRIGGVQKSKKHLYGGKSLLNRADFYSWAINSVEFHLMFDRWEKSGYDRKLTPTVDRIKSEHGYFIDNMRWLTHSQNSRLGAVSRHRKNKVL